MKVIENQNRSPAGVRNSDIVANDIRHLHNVFRLSFRQIAALPSYEGMPPGTINALYHGKIRVPNKYREQHNLPLLVKVPETHVYNPTTHTVKRKTAPRTNGAPKPRKYTYQHMKIRKDDVSSAAATIRAHADPAYIARLTALLNDDR